MDQILTSFGINAKILIWQAINFGLLFLILSKFLYKPLKKKLADREMKIAESLKQAEELDKKTQEFEKELAAKMAKERQEIEKMHTRAVEQQEKLKQELRAQAEKEAQRILAEAKEQSAQEKERILGDVEEEIKKMAVSLASRVLQKEIDDTHHKQALEEALRKLHK